MRFWGLGNAILASVYREEWNRTNGGCILYFPVPNAQLGNCSIGHGEV